MTPLPKRNADKANQSLQLRSVDIARNRPDIGSAAEAQTMAATVAYNLRLLTANEIGDMHHQFCHGCGLSSFTSADSKTHVCGYCGHGPFGPGWCTDSQCPKTGCSLQLEGRGAAPGPDTWWVVEITGLIGDPILVCGECMPQIPPFMNHYQSQLLNPDPVKWGFEKCEGCSKALVIAPLTDLAADSYAGVSQAVQP